MTVEKSELSTLRGGVYLQAEGVGSALLDVQVELTIIAGWRFLGAITIRSARTEWKWRDVGMVRGRRASDLGPPVFKGWNLEDDNSVVRDAVERLVTGALTGGSDAR